MPLYEEINFSNAKEFESYVCDFFSIKYQTKFDTYGTSGQNQYGIDGLHYSPNPDGKKHVIQCKNWNSKELKLSDIKSDIEKTKNLNIKFDVFHFVTSSKKNTKLQDDIANNIQELTNNFQFSFEIHYYSDFFNESLNYDSICNKYFPVFIKKQETEKSRDTEYLLMLARYIESSFVDIPYYISKARTMETPGYSSLSCLTTFHDTVSGGVFYDAKLNEYIEIFLEYIERIDNFRIPHFEFRPNMNTSRLFHLVYIGNPVDYDYISEKIERLIDNFVETFKRFLSYIKSKYFNFDIFKNYYIGQKL
ncbi:hypothetical protein AL485_08745 [Serratia liquefaciens]|uniref:restriction endonuclease n=1 Tax=Serratia TaxID=613 RepID=UPI00076AF324|nr:MULTISPECIES: restriction endonuclease [Serratia]AMG99252.1 hypothetical protein AL485_08745 [Serratia liquefaciens]